MTNKPEHLNDPLRRELFLSGAAGAAALGSLFAAPAKAAGPLHGPSQPLFTMQQVCYVVDDLDEALDFWTKELKVGPFFLFELLALDNQIYRGQPASEPADVTIALGNSGAVQIELAFQHNDAPSVWKKEWSAAGRRGIHHFGFIPEDYRANFESLVDRGFQPAFECDIDGSPLCYFDFLEELGHFVEFWENSPLYRDIFRKTEEAARGWDGSDLVRSWA